MSEWKETEIGLIPSDWHIDKLENYVQPQRGITYGIVKVGDFVPGGVPVIRGGDIRDGSIVFDDQKRVTEEVSNQFRRTILQGGEILLNLIAEPGHAAIVPDELISSNVSRDVAVIPLDDSVDYKFVCYFLRSEASITWLTNRLQGTVTKKINLGVLRDLPILLMPLDEQRRIAHFLDCLDRKIENLRRQNETLERIAQTLFKHWFVDFEFPNEDGKPYRSSGGEMVRSELGEIPAVWRVGNLDDVLSLIIDYRGKTPKKLGGDWSLAGIPALSAKNIKDGRIVREDAINFVDKDLYNKWMKNELQKGDILLTSEAPLGEVVYLASNRKYVLSQRLFSLRTKARFDSTYLYFWLKSPQGQFLLERRATGSTVEGIRQVELRKVEIIIPALGILEKAAFLWLVALEKTENNNQQIRTLTKTRDVLLPQLMSGTLRTKD